MPAYQIDTVRIFSTATSLDGVTVLDPTMVTSVTCQVWTKATPPVKVVDSSTMSWDTNNQEWYFDWNTTSADPGPYEAVVIILGAGLTPFEKREYTTIRLKADKIVSGSV